MSTIMCLLCLWITKKKKLMYYYVRLCWASSKMISFLQNTRQNPKCSWVCVHHSPTKAKKIFRLPSMRSILLKNRGRLCLVPCCLFFQLCCSGYFTDHQKPNRKKKVPGSACPLKLAMFYLLLVLSSTLHKKIIWEWKMIQKEEQI